MMPKRWMTEAAQLLYEQRNKIIGKGAQTAAVKYFNKLEQDSFEPCSKET